MSLKFKRFACSGGFILSAIMTGPVLAQHDGRHQDFHPSASPDGREVVYYSYREPNFPDLFIVDRETLEERQLTDTPGLWEIEPDWSPSANRIAFSRGPSMRALQMVILDLDSGEETVIGHGANVAWSRDGARLAWMQDYTIWIADADGTNAGALDLDSLGEGPKSEPSWTFDGRAVTFLHERPGDETQARFEVYNYVLETGEIEPVTDNQFQESHPQILPGGEELLFGASIVTRNPRLYRMRIDGEGDIHQVSPDEGGEFHYFPSITPDRQHLLFESGQWSANRFYIYEMPLAGEGEARRLTGQAGSD